MSGTGLRAMLRSMEENPMTLTEFLLARIAEDEARIAEGVALVQQVSKSIQSWKDLPPTRPSDMRAMRECEAKRRIVERASIVMVGSSLDGELHPRDDLGLLRILAAVYSDHPDYREEWKP